MRSFPLKSKRRSLMIKHWGLHSRKFRIFPQCSIFQTMPNYIIIIRTWSIISSCHVGNFWCMLYYSFLLFSHFLLFFFLLLKIPMLWAALLACSGSDFQLLKFWKFSSTELSSRTIQRFLPTFLSTIHRPRWAQNRHTSRPTLRHVSRGK